MSDIQPRQSYDELRKRRFGVYEQVPDCKPPETLQGAFSLIRKRRYIFVFNYSDRLGLLIEGKRRKTTLVPLDEKFQPLEEVIALDRNGNGDRDVGDSGDFGRLQLFLSRLKLFIDAPATYGMRCVRIDKPVEAMTLPELFRILPREDFNGFTTVPPDCPPGEVYVSGAFILPTVGVPGLSSRGVTVHLHQLHASAKFHPDKNMITFVVTDCKEGMSPRRGEDHGADGKLDVGSELQPIYNSFLKVFRQLMRNPKGFPTSSCGACLSDI